MRHVLMRYVLMPLSQGRSILWDGIKANMITLLTPFALVPTKHKQNNDNHKCFIIQSCGHRKPAATSCNDSAQHDTNFAAHKSTWNDAIAANHSSSCDYHFKTLLHNLNLQWAWPTANERECGHFLRDDHGWWWDSDRGEMFQVETWHRREWAESWTNKIILLLIVSFVACWPEKRLQIITKARLRTD